MDFNFFLGILINGLAIGAIYGLIAVGYTMVYGVLGLINFAHGDVFTIGAFIGLITFMLALLVPAALPVALVLVGVMIVAMIFTSAWNWAIERLAYRPLRGSFRLAPLITALGLSIALQNFIRINQGPRTKSMPDIITGGFILPGTDVQIFNKQILVFVITAILLTLFSYIVAKTPIGRGMRACAQDSKMASLLGVNVNRVISTTFVMGASLASVAGVIYFFYYGQLQFHDGFIPGIKAFTAAVLGGIGSLPGAVLGGMLIGLIEAFWSAYVPGGNDYKDVAAFAILIIVLTFMPTGLMGRPEVEKV